MKKLKRFSALILACIMLCGLLPATALAAGVTYQGSGTEEDPYLISSQAQLAGITTDKSYKLINDIKLVNWNPIPAAFAGTFNGNGYTISDLRAPLFKTVLSTGATAVTIKNVNLITAKTFSGAATVFAARGNGDESAQITVDNVHATINGTVTTSGLVGEPGEKNKVRVNNCSVVVSANGSIVDNGFGTSFAGGIIKHMRANTTIENSYVYIQSGGKITANLQDAGSYVGAGGIAAAMPFAANSTTQIKNCYVINEGTIQSSKADGSIPVQGAGGLLGISYSNSGSVNGRSIANSYVYDSGTIQSVDGAGLKVDNRQGCIYGYHSGATGVPSVSGAYFNSTSSAPAIGAANDTVAPTTGTAGRTLEEMKIATNLPLLQINEAGFQWKSVADRAPADKLAPTTLQGLPYLLMEDNAQFAPASLTYYKGEAGVDVTTTVTGGGALQSITKDGVAVDAANYTLVGSTLTIKSAFLEPLAVGKIVLKLTFAEGQPNRELEIDIVQRTGIEVAKGLIESGTYTFAQATANTAETVKTALVAQISALSGMTATGVTVAAENVTVTDFVAAVAGTATSQSGTNGSFKFTVTLGTGGSSATTTAKTETITATAHVPATLTSIAVTTPPTKTTYTAGETFAPAGMVVTATYNDGTTKPVENYTTTPTGALAVENTAVTVSYEEGGVTKTATVAITVNSAPVTSQFALSITTDADSYHTGDTVTAEVYLAYTVTGGAAIGSLGAQITYDPLLTCTNITGVTAAITGTKENGKISLVSTDLAGFAITEAGTKIATITFTVGALTQTTPAPIGFNAAGCYVTKVGADGTLLAPTVATKSVSLVKQYTVTFDLGTHGQTAGTTTLTVDAGYVLADKDIPMVTSKTNGYKFTGWNVTPVGVTVNEDKTFTAQFEADTVPVKFYDYSGTQIGTTQNVQIGQKATAADAVRSGYTFSGWFVVTDPATKYDSTTPVLTTAHVNATTVTAAVSYKAAYEYKLTYTATGATVTGITSDSVIAQGSDITFTLAPQSGYIAAGATVNYSVDGADKGAVTKIGETYTISAIDVVGHVAISIVYPLDVTVTLIENFGAVPTSGMNLVKVVGTPATGKVYAVDGNKLFYSDKAKAYVGFVAGTYTNATIGAAVTVVDGTAEIISYTGDIDGNFKVLPNDARIVYTYYSNNKNYVITGGDAAYLALDYDGSLAVDVADVAAIVQAYLTAV